MDFTRILLPVPAFVRECSAASCLHPCSASSCPSASEVRLLALAACSPPSCRTAPVFAVECLKEELQEHLKLRHQEELHEHVRHQEELQEHLRPAAAGNASRAAAVHSLCKNPCCRTCTSAGSRRRAPVQDAQPIVARAKAAS